MNSWIHASMLCLLVSIGIQASVASKAIVIYDNKVTEVGASRLVAANPNDLWISLADLKLATGFVNKPQGVCRNELCFPLPRNRRAEFLHREGNSIRFNLTEFARMLKQPVARDADQATWYFGPRPEVQNSYLQNFQAPNFTLPDKNGKLHSLLDFRGRKVLIVTWASW